jgi:signal transduction histidine kinase
MRSGSSRVRTKVVALLLSMTALWAFAAWVTLREGLSLLYVSTGATDVGKPAETLFDTLQDERRLTTVYLGGGHAAAARSAMTAARARTDAARTRFETRSSSAGLRFAASGELRQRIADERAALQGLARLRGQIDSASVNRAEAADGFSSIIATGFRMYNALSSLDDQQIAKESRSLIGLTRARELLSQEDALLAGALAAGRFTGDEPQQFIELVGQRRYFYQDASGELPRATVTDYQTVMGGADLTRLQSLEDQVIHDKNGATLPFTAGVWDDAIKPARTDLRDLELRGADVAIKDATPVAIGVIVRLLLAGGLGLIAVIAAIILSITTARALVRQLERLRNAAHELSDDRLPRVVERLRRGEEVDVALEAPPLQFGGDEIGQVGRAFNAVQETAVRVAVEQAELRRGVRDVFLSLARRSQALLHRQLGLLDTMERRAGDAEELADLFRVDHLATRMRRNAENLIVLSGAVAGRGWRNPVPIVDVVRGALAEVEDYTRVTVLPIEPAALAGRAVGDVIHLLAELIENAVSFSPPYTAVHVGGALVANGFAVEIEDRGLGMGEADLAAANEQLAHPPEFNLTSTARLGLYVVGRLAERHGIKVRLRESPYGGTTAIVLIPMVLVVDAQHASVPRPRTGSGPMAIAPGRSSADTATGAATGMVDARPAWPDGGEEIEPAPVAAPPHDPAVPSWQTEPLRLVEPVGYPDDPPGAAPPLPTRQRTGDDQPVSATGTAPRSVREEPDGEAPPPVRERPQDTTAYTPAGLPWRVRQASLAPPLRSTGAARAEPPAPEADEATSRGPEEIRRMMASYQTGTLRGRTEAYQLAAARRADEPAPQPATAQPPAERNPGDMPAGDTDLPVERG